MSTFELELRDYLRDDTAVMAILNNDDSRMNMDYAGNEAATHVTISRAGGSMNGYYPFDYPVFSLNCHGSTRPAAAALTSAVTNSLRALSSVNVPLLTASVESVVYLPTTPDGVARYVVTTVVTSNMGLTA